MQGQLILAKLEAKSALEQAERARDWGKRMRAWSRLGAACYLRGEILECEEAFKNAEALQSSGDPTRPWLHSDYGIYYRIYRVDTANTCENYRDILDEASGAMEHGDDRYWLVPSGFDALVKAVALWRIGDTATASKFFDKSRSMLESSGAIVYLPLYLLPQAVFELDVCKDLEEAKNHVTKAAGIASEYGLRLLAIDADLALVRIEIESKSYIEAEKRLDSVRDSVIDCTYNLRWTDIALAEAELAVLQERSNACEQLERAERLVNDYRRFSLVNRISYLKKRYAEGIGSSTARAAEAGLT